MWITQPIATRLFVWLAVIATPFQGLPAAACGCARVTLQLSAMSGLAQEAACCSQPRVGQCPCTGASVCHCGEASSCSQSEPSCCSSESAADSGCQCAGNCQCGGNCQCTQDNTPTEPTIPPVENSSSDRIVVDSASTASLSTIYLPTKAPQQLDRNVGANALTALDSCVALCRFAL